MTLGGEVKMKEIGKFMGIEKCKGKGCNGNMIIQDNDIAKCEKCGKTFNFARND